MIHTPYISIDLAKIEHNAHAIVVLCAQQGVDVTGVTKVTCGNPQVAKAMLRGGVVSLADSRLENIRRMRQAGIATDYLLLREPALSRADEVVAYADASVNSELLTLQALSAAARRQGKIHRVIIMVDLGDLREGLWPDEVPAFLSAAANLEGIQITGLGSNLSCFAGVVPDIHNMQQLVALTRQARLGSQHPLRIVSGINSSGLPLIASNQLPEGINHARIGEAILLGRETIQRHPWPGTYQDAFTLHAEIVEVKEKPSLPRGDCAQDAFGHYPVFEDLGIRKRALLNLGREDVDIEGMTPMLENVKIIGASSGYLLVDVTEAQQPLQVGDILSFSLNYAALLAAMTSEYVYKLPLNT